MKRYALTALILVAIGSASQVEAMQPDRIPTTYKGVVTTILRSDRVSMGCGIGSQASSWTSIFAYSVDSIDGQHLSEGYDAFSNRYDAGTYIAVQAGDVSLDPVPDVAQSSGGIYIYRIPRHARDATLRVAWAGWNAQISCGVYVNNIEIPAVDLPRTNALYASVTDFRGGAGAAVKLAGEGIAAAGAADSFEQPENGFLLALGMTQAQEAILDLTASGPEGQHVTGDASSPLMIHEATNGLWDFGLNSEVSVLGDGPLLYLLQMP